MDTVAVVVISNYKGKYRIVDVGQHCSIHNHNHNMNLYSTIYKAGQWC